MYQVGFSLRLISILVASLLCASHGEASEGPRPLQVDRVEIYFVPWDVQTVVSLWPENVREKPQVTASLRNPFIVQRFVQELHLDDLQPASEDREGDARLVIDLILHDGAGTVSVYATRDHLLSFDARFRRPIDERFRARFSGLVPITASAN